MTTVSDERLAELIKLYTPAACDCNCVGYEQDTIDAIRELQSLRASRAQSERDAVDARRYRWLRTRLQIGKQGSVAKPAVKRAVIETRLGCSFVDSPLPHSAKPERGELLSAELDTAIDSALAALSSTPPTEAIEKQGEMK